MSLEIHFGAGWQRSRAIVQMGAEMQTQAAVQPWLKKENLGGSSKLTI
jgi:hypothetical protein